MNLKLIKITSEYKDQLIEMIEEWSHDIKTNHTNGSPASIFRLDPHDFDHYQAHLEITNPKSGYVPDSTFFCLDIERNRLVGAINIRHYLNERLLAGGGHIGDGIRPSERQKGYATAMVALGLEECKKLGIKRVLMCCDQSNIASAKTIIKNGGVLENEVIDEDGEVVQRYWINLTD